MYLQKEVQFQQGKLIGCDDNGDLFQGIVTFMIVGVWKNVPFVVKAVPESKIEEKWLSGQIIESIQSLHEIGFHGQAAISDNHSATCPPSTATNGILSNYGSESHENVIAHHSTSGRRNLFYDSVHPLKNVQNNPLNSRRSIFLNFIFLTLLVFLLGRFHGSCFTMSLMKMRNYRQT